MHEEQVQLELTVNQKIQNAQTHKDNPAAFYTRDDVNEDGELQNEYQKNALNPNMVAKMEEVSKPKSNIQHLDDMFN